MSISINEIHNLAETCRAGGRIGLDAEGNLTAKHSPIARLAARLIPREASSTHLEPGTLQRLEALLLGTDFETLSALSSDERHQLEQDLDSIRRVVSAHLFESAAPKAGLAAVPTSAERTSSITETVYAEKMRALAQRLEPYSEYLSPITDGPAIKLIQRAGNLVRHLMQQASKAGHRAAFHKERLLLSMAERLSSAVQQLGRAQEDPAMRKVLEQLLVAAERDMASVESQEEYDESIYLVIGSCSMTAVDQDVIDQLKQDFRTVLKDKYGLGERALAAYQAALEQGVDYSDKLLKALQPLKTRDTGDPQLFERMLTAVISIYRLETVQALTTMDLATPDQKWGKVLRLLLGLEHKIYFMERDANSQQKRVREPLQAMNALLNLESALAGHLDLKGEATLGFLPKGGLSLSSTDKVGHEANEYTHTRHQELVAQLAEHGVTVEDLGKPIAEQLSNEHKSDLARLRATTPQEFAAKPEQELDADLQAALSIYRFMRDRKMLLEQALPWTNIFD